MLATATHSSLVEQIVGAQRKKSLIMLTPRLQKCEMIFCRFQRVDKTGDDGVKRRFELEVNDVLQQDPAVEVEPVVCNLR